MVKITTFNLMRSLSSVIYSENFKDLMRKIATAFTRRRKMLFCDIIFIVLSARNRAVQTELDDYFAKKGVDENVSRQAFAKARENLKHEAFIHLNDVLVEKFEREDGAIATYRGYRLFGVDGTLIDLPNTEEMRRTYGFASNNTDKVFAKGLAMTAFDVLNGITIFAELFRYDDSEKRRILYISDGFAQLNYEKSIWLLDRGYPSFDLFARFHNNHQCYLTRVQTQTLKEVEAASQPDQIVTLTRKGITLDLRVVNVTLDSGENEKLITNLPADFTVEDLKALYIKRWGIETNYRFLKQKAVVETFTGETNTAVLQDFHAAILILNIATIAWREQADILKEGDKNKQQKNEYFPNKSKLIQEIKCDFVKFVLCDNPVAHIYRQLHLYSRIKRYAYHLSYVKSFPRAVKPGYSGRSVHTKANL